MPEHPGKTAVRLLHICLSQDGGEAHDAIVAALAAAEQVGKESATPAWVDSPGPDPELGAFAWVLWNGVIQKEPWQWVAREDEPNEFMFDGHCFTRDEIDAYLLIPFPVLPKPEPTK